MYPIGAAWYDRGVVGPMRINPAALLSLCLLLAGVSFDAAADELQLRNGDFISGHIVSMDEVSVVIRTSYGELTIDRSQVLSGSFSTDESIPLEGRTLELLFDNETDYAQGPGGSSAGGPAGGTGRLPNLRIAEYGVLPAAGADGVADSAIRSTGKGTYLEITGLPELDSADTMTISF